MTDTFDDAVENIDVEKDTVDLNLGKMHKVMAMTEICGQMMFNHLTPREAAITSALLAAYVAHQSELEFGKQAAHEVLDAVARIAMNAIDQDIMDHMTSRVSDDAPEAA